MEYLYKYKSGSDLDIQAIEQEYLWVSTYTYMNDPTDFPIYANTNNTGITEEQIDQFAEEFEKTHCVISFSTSPKAKQLWDYYTGNTSGLVIAYKKEQIIAQLQKNKISYNEGHVKYDGKSFDLTDVILGTKKEIDTDSFFHKTSDWKGEKEYRFVFDYDKEKPYYSTENGFKLSNLKPSHIFIGYKMKKENKERIKAYCKDKNICLYQVSPNRTTPDRRLYNVKYIKLTNKSSELADETICLD